MKNKSGRTGRVFASRTVDFDFCLTAAWTSSDPDPVVSS